MAEYLIQDTTMQAIANPIKSMVGSTSALTPAQIGTAAEDANTEVGTQADLMSQIITALEGKGQATIPDGCVDTSDATATAEDMAEGVTAYVNGMKVAGTVKTRNSGQGATLPSEDIELSDYSNIQILCKSLIKEDVLLRTGSYANAYPYKSDFGNATAENVASGKTFTSSAGLKVTGSMVDNGAVTKTLDSSTTSYTVPAGYHNGSGKVNISTETKTATPTTSSQTVTPSSGKVLSKVTVNAIPSQYVDTSDATATSENISNGKTAYVNGKKVTGTHICDGGIDTSDATATAEDIVSPATAYVNGEKVTGSLKPSAINTDVGSLYVGVDDNNKLYFRLPNLSSSYGKRRVVDVDQNITLRHPLANFGDATAADVVAGKTFTSAAGLKVTGTHECTGGIDTSDATATAGDILSGKTAYVNGEKITGSIASKSTTTYTPGTSDQTIASGQYLSGDQTIKGDSNLLASNIKSGVSIFGVSGSYNGSGGSGDIQAQHITSKTDQITISGTGTVKVWGYGY